jgi:hypothetical protein
VREALRHRVTHTADADPAELVLLHVCCRHFISFDEKQKTLVTENTEKEIRA